MKYDLIIFDLAGTTVKDNKDVHRVLQSALQKYDVNISLEDANAVMGIPKPIAIRDLLLKRHTGTREITSAWIEEIHRDFVKDMIAFYESAVSVGEKEGVSNTFDQLRKQGIKVAVNTGFDRGITDAILKRLGWRENGLIDHSITSDEVLRGRPYPDMIEKLMKQAMISDPAKVVKVGDTASDINEGRAARCGLVIGVTTGAYSREMLQLENPDHLIERLPEVLDLVL